MVWLNKMIIYYEDAGLSPTAKEWTLGLKDKLELDIWMPPRLPLCPKCPLHPSVSQETYVFASWLARWKIQVTSSSRVYVSLSSHEQWDSTDLIPTPEKGILVRLLATGENTGWVTARATVTPWPCWGRGAVWMPTSKWGAGQITRKITHLLEQGSILCTAAL